MAATVPEDLAPVLHLISDPLVCFDAADAVVWANAAFHRAGGAEGGTLAEAWPPDWPPCALLLAQVTAAPDSWVTVAGVTVRLTHHADLRLLVARPQVLAMGPMGASLAEELLAITPLQLSVFDPDGRYLYITPSAVRNPEVRAWLLGKTDEDYADFRHLDPAFGQMRRSRIRRAAREQCILELDEARPDSEGVERHFRRYLHPLVNAEGQTQFVFGYGVEMTDRVLAEAQARALNEQLQHLNEHLEERVFERTRDLQTTVAQLEAEIRERQLAEEALRESEARYRVLADNVTDAITRHTPEGVYTYLSRHSARVSGYAVEDLLGINAFTLVHEDDLEQLWAIFLQGLRDRTPQTFTYRLRHMAGHYVWVESTGQMLFDAATDAPSEFILVTRDISDRKHAEEALRTSEERYRLLAENVSDAISRHTIDGTYIYASAAISRNIGYHPEELVGINAFTHMHPDDADGCFEVLVEALRTREPGSVTYRLQHRDGHYVWIESTGRILYDAETDQPTEFILVSRDVTERKRAEKALRASEERYRLLATAISDAITRHTPEGVYTFTNPAGAQMVDEQAQDLLGTNAFERIHPDDADRCFDAFVQGLRTHEAQTFSYRLRRRDGSYRWVESTGTAVFDPATNQPVELVVVTRDISERKRAEDEIRLALEKERELNVLKSRFVTMVSHEFRTPLAAINGAAQMLERHSDRLTPERRTAYLERIQRNVRDMTELMEDMLFLGRDDAGRTTYQPQTLDFHSFLISVIEETQASYEATDRIVLDIEAQPIRVHLDAGLIRQALINLLSNALKYSPDGQPVHVRVSATDADLVVAVEDHGIGIPEADLARLFEPFHRASNVGNIRGTGLGLSITRRAVELHHGRLTVQSQPGRGTTFRLHLPRHSAPPQPIASA